MLEQTRVGSSKLEYARAYSSMPRPLEHAKAARVRSSRLEQGAEFARVLEHRSPLGSSMLVCNTKRIISCCGNLLEIKGDHGASFGLPRINHESNLVNKVQKIAAFRSCTKLYGSSSGRAALPLGLPLR